MHWTWGCWAKSN